MKAIRPQSWWVLMKRNPSRKDLMHPFDTSRLLDSSGTESSDVQLMESFRHGGMRYPRLSDDPLCWRHLLNTTSSSFRLERERDRYLSTLYASASDKYRNLMEMRTPSLRGCIPAVYLGPLRGINHSLSPKAEDLFCLMSATCTGDRPYFYVPWSVRLYHTPSVDKLSYPMTESAEIFA